MLRSQTLLLLVVACCRARAETVATDVSTFAELKGAVRQAPNNQITGTRVNILANIRWEEEVVVSDGQSIELVSAERGAVLLNATAALTRHLRVDVGGTLSLHNLFFTGGSLARADYGGVIYNGGSIKTMRGCSFFRNEAGAGGVVHNTGTIKQMANCSFEDNKAMIRGGVVYNNGAIAEITDCTFARNSAIWGGVIRNDGFIGAIGLCKFRENRAGFGGAFFQGSFSQPVFFVGTMFAGNNPSDVCVEGSGNVRLHETVLSPTRPDPIEGRASGCPGFGNDHDAGLGMVFDLEAWDIEGMFRCKLCSVGTYMNREVHATTSNMITACFPCPAGTVNDQQGQESCAACLASHHLVPSADATACECAEGWTTDMDISFNATTERQCTCPTGHYQEGTSCVPCEPGTFKDMLGTEKALCIPKDTTLVVGLAAGGAVLGAVLLVFLGRLGYKKVHSYYQLQRENQKRKMATILKAVETTHQLEYPVCVVRAADFCDAGMLVQHERLRDQNKLIAFDSLEDVRFPRSRHPIIFFSHQWTAFGKPDHTNKHYELMKRSVAEVCAAKGWEIEDVLVWVDFCSIPQVLPTLQSLAINSLAAYASVAQAFVVIAPKVEHCELGTVCDEDSYRLRTWCRAEQFAHALRNGHENIWLAFEDAVAVPIEADWLKSSALRVFDGELTCCRLKHRGMERCDRESLLIPILGLYGELYASRNMRGYKLMWEKIVAEGHGAIFPREFEFVKDDQKNTSETRTLFGHLVEEIHGLIDSDEGIRRRLLATREANTLQSDDSHDGICI